MQLGQGTFFPAPFSGALNRLPQPLQTTEMGMAIPKMDEPEMRAVL